MDSASRYRALPVLLYLLYGDDPRFWEQARYSILTALGQGSEGYSILVATDHPERAEGWPVSVWSFDAEQLATWAGPAAYLHRSKNRAMAAVMDAHPEQVVCLVDSDTWFMASPEGLFQRVGPGRSLLHASEGPLGEGHPQIVERWRAHGSAPADVEALTMLNSGVVGLHPADRGLLDIALARVDAIYAATQVFNAEQLGLGLVLTERTEVSFADDLVRHYWGRDRPFLQVEIARFLRQSGGLSVEARARAAVAHTPRVPAVSWRVKLRTRWAALWGRWSEELRLGLEAELMAERSADWASAWRERARLFLRVAEPPPRPLAPSWARRLEAVESSSLSPRPASRTSPR